MAAKKVNQVQCLIQYRGGFESIVCCTGSVCSFVLPSAPQEENSEAWEGKAEAGEESEVHQLRQTLSEGTAVFSKPWGVTAMSHWQVCGEEIIRTA